MATYVLRVWLPDRPGALGAVASRVGAVGGDLVGIDILERGAGRAVDELVIDIPDDDERMPLLLAEIAEVDGVDIEQVTPVAEALRDPRLDALETAAMLVGAHDPGEAIAALCEHASRTLGASWAAVIDLETGEVDASDGDAPTSAWLSAFVAGSQSSAQVANGDAGPDDTVWAPLPQAGKALVIGRHSMPFRARERRQASALARIVDTRFREIAADATRMNHPSVG
jgi:hypothetical protein